MAFDYRAIIRRAEEKPFFDTSPGQYANLLQIRVTPAIVPSGAPVWRAICGYHIPSSGGNPNICLSAINEAGQVIIPSTTGQMMVFGWDWEGRRPWEPARPVNGDKGINEPSANINLGKGQIATVWVLDSIPSDKVFNLRTDWPDALYHTSTFVCFRYTTSDTPIPPDPPSNDYERGLDDGVNLARDAILEALSDLP